MSYPIHIVYEKLGRAKYISHLDMDRCLSRAFKRCRLPIWYTEGFNKRMYISLTVPLSLGFESKYEVMELKLEEEMPFEEILSRINAVMPEGIRMYKVAYPSHKPGAITDVSYDVTLQCENPQEIAKQLAAFLSKEQILIEKKNKKGVVSEVDLKPLMTIGEITCGEKSVSYSGRYAFGQAGTVNPTQLIGAFAASMSKESLDFAPQIVRTGIYAGEELFVK